MAGGAPLGNQHAAKAKVWSAAINRALDRRAQRSCVDRLKAIDDLAEKLLDLCDQGDLGALKELGDRLEGTVAPASVTGALRRCVSGMTMPSSLSSRSLSARRKVSTSNSYRPALMSVRSACGTLMTFVAQLIEIATG